MRTHSGCRARHRRFIAALFATLFALACAKRPTARVREDIEAGIKKGIRAVQTKNVDEYLALIPDEAFGPDSAIVAVRRQAARADLERDWAAIKKTRALTAKLDSVHVLGDSAVVEVTLHWDRLVFAADGKATDTVISTLHHREVWRRKRDGWRPFDVVSKTLRNTVNGVERALVR